MKSLRVAARIVACILFLSPLRTAAWSQAVPTASKSQEISAFGAAMGGSTDYGPRAYVGAAAGLDYTFFPRWRIAPSFEIRGDELLGQDITEKTVQFGPRLQMDFRDRFHPYVDFLYGGGEVQFHSRQFYIDLGYTGDRGRAISYGGGINIDLTHHLGAKFDIQGQNLNFGQNGAASPDGYFTLSPVVVAAGLVYTIPFRKHNHREDFR